MSTIRTIPFDDLFLFGNVFTLVIVVSNFLVLVQFLLRRTVIGPALDTAEMKETVTVFTGPNLKRFEEVELALKYAND